MQPKNKVKFKKKKRLSGPSTVLVKVTIFQNLFTPKQKNHKKYKRKQSKVIVHPLKVQSFLK